MIKPKQPVTLRPSEAPSKAVELDRAMDRLGQITPPKPGVGPLDEHNPHITEWSEFAIWSDDETAVKKIAAMYAKIQKALRGKHQPKLRAKIREFNRFLRERYWLLLMWHRATRDHAAKIDRKTH